MVSRKYAGNSYQSSDINWQPYLFHNRAKASIHFTSCHIMGVFELECHNPGPPTKILDGRYLLATTTLRKI
jgi:hypothetical protein